MDKKVHRNKGKQRRRAISPVIATVILIAITLIAAVAIGGFVFGLFGSFTSSAQVSEVSISFTATKTYGNLTLSNSGTSSTSALSGTIKFGGVTYPFSSLQTSTGSTCSSSVPCTVTAGTTTTIGIVLATAPSADNPAGTSGETFTGTIVMANGASVPITGTFS